MNRCEDVDVLHDREKYEQEVRVVNERTTKLNYKKQRDFTMIYQDFDEAPTTDEVHSQLCPPNEYLVRGYKLLGAAYLARVTLEV